jgi:hypothetical protein
MGCSWGLARRTFLRSWIGALLGKAAASAASRGFDPVSLTLRGFAPASAFQRRYRMDATILLLGAPIFKRTSAGGGYASVEISSVDGASAVALQFAAGSNPARAHGLNRFGILREAAINDAGASTPELSFAGLMTHAREESFEQGRKALFTSTHSTEGVLARGRTAGPVIQTWIEPINLRPDRNWTNATEALCDALHRGPIASPRESAADSTTTFLCAMRAAALCAGPIVRRDFMHAGKLYRLETRRHQDHPCELAGTIHNTSGGRCAEFRTSYAPGDESGIPIRIDYRPRSFLRLTFEADLEANQPPVPSLFQQESA